MSENYYGNSGDIYDTHGSPAEPDDAPAPITDDEIRTAIAVLQAYASGILRTDLCDELDQAIEAAASVMGANADYDYPDDDPGFDPMYEELPL